MPPSDLPFSLNLTLRSGTVYYFTHRGLQNTAEPHYFIVINADPQSDRVLIMTVGSSQIEKTKLRRRNMPGETLVEVDSSEYPDFTKETIIDCNQVFELSREELVQKYQARELRSHQDFPADAGNRNGQDLYCIPDCVEAVS